MNLDELRPILAGYRKQVAPAWSAATAHPGFDGKPGDPAGQCGVTSAWLQRRLLEDHGIETWYCIGEMVCLIHEEHLRDHCWLEIGDGRGRILVDFTSTQIPCGFGTESGAIGDLAGVPVRYYAKKRLAAALIDDPVQERLAILTAALS